MLFCSSCCVQLGVNIALVIIDISTIYIQACFQNQIQAIGFIILQIFFATCAVLKIGEYINNNLHLARKICKDICPWTLSISRSEPFSKSVAQGKLELSFKEQTKSKDKYPSIFSRQMKAIVFVIPQIFFTTCVVLKIGEHPRIFPSFSYIWPHDAFRPIAPKQRYLMDYNFGYSSVLAGEYSVM